MTRKNTKSCFSLTPIPVSHEYIVKQMLK